LKGGETRKMVDLERGGKEEGEREACGSLGRNTLFYRSIVRGEKREGKEQIVMERKIEEGGREVATPGLLLPLTGSQKRREQSLPGGGGGIQGGNLFYVPGKACGKKAAVRA